MSFCSSREKQFQCRERKGAQGSSPAHPGTMRREQRGSQRNQTVSRATHCPLLVHFREQNQSPEPAGGGWTTGRPSIAALRAVGSPGGGGVEHAHALTPDPHVPRAPLPCLKHLCNQARCFGCHLHLTESSLRPSPFHLLPLPPQVLPCQFSYEFHLLSL